MFIEWDHNAFPLQAEVNGDDGIVHTIEITEDERLVLKRLAEAAGIEIPD